MPNFLTDTSPTRYLIVLECKGSKEFILILATKLFLDYINKNCNDEVLFDYKWTEVDRLEYNKLFKFGICLTYNKEQQFIIPKYSVEDVKRMFKIYG